MTTRRANVLYSATCEQQIGDRARALTSDVEDRQPFRLAGPVAVPCQQLPRDGRHVPGAVDHGDINALAAALMVDLRQSATSTWKRGIGIGARLPSATCPRPRIRTGLPGAHQDHPDAAATSHAYSSTSAAGDRSVHRAVDVESVDRRPDAITAGRRARAHCSRSRGKPGQWWIPSSPKHRAPESKDPRAPILGDRQIRAPMVEPHPRSTAAMRPNRGDP